MTYSRADLQRAAGISHTPTDLTYDCRMAINGDGPRAYDWADKPHRLVYDLCSAVERLEAALREIAAEASVPVRTKKKGGIKHKWMYRRWRKIAVERIDIARATLKGADHE